MHSTWILLLLLTLFLLTGCSSTPDTSVDEELNQQLEELLGQFDGVAGVYVYNLKTKKEAFVNPDTLFPTASTVKVPILVGIFKKIEEGKLDYHQPMMYRDSLASGGSGVMQHFKDSIEVDLSLPITLMISHSDNTASLWCQDLAGGGKEINAWLDKNGYKDTRVNSRTKGREAAWKKYGWGQTTPREMTELLIAIRENKVLSPASSERMYRNLTNIYWDDYALHEIPPSIQTASKQGMVDASRSELVMVNAPSGDYAFYIATKNNEDQRWKPDNESWQLARDVSRLLWNYFEPDHPWKPAENASNFFDWGENEDNQ